MLQGDPLTLALLNQAQLGDIDLRQDVSLFDDASGFFHPSLPGYPYPEETVDGDFRLIFAGNVDGVDFYNVYRGNSAGGPHDLVFGGYRSDYAVYTESRLISGQVYCYVVTSVVNGIESLNSNEACATPEARRRRR